MALENEHHYFHQTVSKHSRFKVVRINNMIAKRKCFDLLTNSLNTFFKEMYGSISQENLYVDTGRNAFIFYLQTIISLWVLSKS